MKTSHPQTVLFNINYLTMAFTASSPSTATTTTPCGVAITALAEEITVLATTWPKVLLITTFFPAALKIVT